jgi:hypothetical protein
MLWNANALAAWPLLLLQRGAIFVSNETYQLAVNREATKAI